MLPRNLDDLAVFVRVVECGSFSAAARATDLAPTTVSKQIARLERQFAASLFERSTRRLKVTEEGRAIAERARMALALLEEAAEIARAGSADLTGTIRITAPVPFGSRYVAAATAAFRKLHPKVGFELHLTDRIVDLYADEIDLAIRVAKLSDSRLIARRLADNRRILVASPDYLQRNGEPTQPCDLDRHTCQLFSYPGLMRKNWRLRHGADAVEITPVGDLVTDSGDTLRTWCLAGLGISLRELWDCCGRYSRRQSGPGAPGLGGGGAPDQPGSHAPGASAQADQRVRRLPRPALVHAAVAGMKP